MEYIQHVKEPKRLILAWQAPDQFNSRFRWAVGELSRGIENYEFRYFNEMEFSALNQGKTSKELSALGYRGYPVFHPDPKMIYTRSVLLPFLRRLPPRSRADFSDYLRNFMISPSASLSDFALLAITEAKLPSDGFSLVDEFSGTVGARELFLELAGHRYYAPKLRKKLTIDAPVEVAEEPTNPHDPNAIIVRHAGECIGYINRLQARAFSVWLQENRIEASLRRIREGGENPRAYIFVKVLP